MREEMKTCLTDGRSIKWIARAYCPPEHNEHTDIIIKDMGVVTQEEADFLASIRERIENLTRSGTQAHREMLKLAKRNRTRIKKKWDAGRNLTKRLSQPSEEPAHITQTLNLLNGKQT